ncbi:MAG: 3-dehydroquinate synthase [Ruminococcaceae bacterium]|nr:3-dehydroquinate synthase [Oscillospiraceae bacterium]
MTVRINASKPYDVFIERGLLKKAGKLASNIISPSKALIVTDDIVDSLYSKTLEDSLNESGFGTYKFVFKNGETSKNIETFSEILNYMAEIKMTRNDVVFALGGGVTGDLSGFAAASYMRGIKFVQIPTTFLAAVDSSVGGKCGINLKNGKNLAGAFHQPSIVLCDPNTFKTLPLDVLSDGISEAIKSGIIKDSSLFFKFRDGSYIDNLDSIVSACVKIKGNIIENDEFEGGMRKLLNLGHTVGHAVEKCSNYKISHGHAISIGMAVAAKSAEKSGLSKEGTADEIITTLKRCSLPVSCEFTADKLTEVILNDKKRIDNKVTFVLPESIGNCIMHDIEICDIKDFISLGMGE